MSEISYTCNKKDCFFCYETNRREVYCKDPGDVLDRKNGWSKNEERFLKDHYNEVAIDDLVKIFKRDRRSIWLKANKMNLYKYKRSAA